MSGRPWRIHDGIHRDDCLSTFSIGSDVSGGGGGGGGGAGAAVAAAAAATVKFVRRRDQRTTHHEQTCAESTAQEQTGMGRWEGEVLYYHRQSVYAPHLCQRNKCTGS